MWVLRKIFVEGRWRKGQAMTEYAMILGMIALVAFTGYVKFGKSVNSVVKNDYQTIKAIKLPKAKK